MRIQSLALATMLLTSPLRSASAEPAGPTDTFTRSVVPETPVLNVPDTRQSTNYSCGAAALQAVLAYYGIQETEEDLMEKLGTTPDQGTRPEAILRVAQSYGLQAELRQNVSLEDLARETAAGRPVIVDAQAWREDSLVPWKDRWEDGHYMVAVGVDSKNVYLEDPSLDYSKGFIPREQFMERWHDYEVGPKGERQEYRQAAIFFRGKTPAPPPVFLPVD